jgi:hypothetical protein
MPFLIFDVCVFASTSVPLNPSFPQEHFLANHGFISRNIFKKVISVAGKGLL